MLIRQECKFCSAKTPTDGCLRIASGVPCFFDPPRGTLAVLAVPPDCVAAPVSALDMQVGGSHYKDMAIQPAEYLHRNGIGFIEGAIIKYVSRYKAKNGVEDLEKARHFLDMLIEFETAITTERAKS